MSSVNNGYKSQMRDKSLATCGKKSTAGILWTFQVSEHEKTGINILFKYKVWQQVIDKTPEHFSMTH